MSWALLLSAVLGSAVLPLGRGASQPEQRVEAALIGASQPEQRVEAALIGALVADVIASRSHRISSETEIKEAYFGSEELGSVQAALGASLEGLGAGEEVPWHHTECGDELLVSLEIVASQGFELERFAQAWRRWAAVYQGFTGPGTEEALRGLFAGVPARATGSHFIDFAAGSRVPALLLLYNQAGEDELAAAAREIVLPTHGNPKVTQAAEFLLRAVIELLRSPPLAQDTSTTRREATLSALRAAAAGSPLGGVVEEALAEAQSRDAISAAGLSAGKLAEAHTDKAVLGRLTASGAESGNEVEGGKTSYLTPAIIWLVVAYDTFTDAVIANALLGGESALRAIFVGLLLVARDGPAALPINWVQKLLVKRPPTRRPFLAGLPFSLCASPGACHGAEGWAEELEADGVALAAAILRSEQAGLGSLLQYRIFVRINASGLLRPVAGELTKPHDWDEDEDGEWDTAQGTLDQVSCLARYFQFTSAGGRHAQFGLWPAQAMCHLTVDKPVAHESFNVVLTEPLTDVIGGVVLGSKDRILKLPRLSTHPDASEPSWARLCRHVGTVRLPEGQWDLEEEEERPGRHRAFSEL